MNITLDELRKKYEELGAMIKAYEEQQEEAEFPKDGDIFFYINGRGDIQDDEYTEKTPIAVEVNKKMLSIGNIFRTQEEAEFAVEQLKVIAEMKRCGGVWQTKKDCETSYLLHFSYDDEICVENWKSEDVIPIMWFPTEEAAQKAIDTIGEERLLKYWFCVEV